MSTPMMTGLRILSDPGFGTGGVSSVRREWGSGETGMLDGG